MEIVKEEVTEQPEEDTAACLLKSSSISSKIFSTLQELYSNNLLLDIELHDSEGNYVAAHMAVLAAASPTVKDCLLQSGDASVRRLLFQNITASQWRYILDFVYLGEVLLPIDELIPMEAVSKQLKIAELMDLCRSTIKQILPTFSQEQSIIKPRKKRSPGPKLKVLGPGRGSSNPFTKDGVLAKHRLVPFSKGTIQGPYGTVDIDTSLSSTDDIMKSVQKVFHNPPQPPEISFEKSIKTIEQISLESPRKKLKTADNHEEDEEETGDNQDDSSSANKQDVKDADIGYRCSICNVKLGYGAELFEHHQKYHAKENTFPAESSTSADVASVPFELTKSFKCDECDKSYYTEKSLRCHQQLNCKNVSKLWTCTECGVKYHFHHFLDSHIIKAHPQLAKEMFPNEVPCPACPKTFMTKSLLNKHIGYAHKELKNSKGKGKDGHIYACPHCSKYVVNMKKHLALCTSKKTLICEICNESFLSLGDLKRHNNYKHTEKECLYCKGKFANRQLLVDHLISDCEHITEEVKQDLCLKVTNAKLNKVHNCPECNKTFPNRRTLSEHNASVHNIQDNMYCTTCSKQFKTASQFRIHMIRHFNIRKEKCAECDRTFVDKRDMMKHVKSVHRAERPYKCPNCEWAFKDVSALYMHSKRKHGVNISGLYRGKKGRPTPRVNKDLTDDQLTQALIESYMNEDSSDSIMCPICKTPFRARHNMNAHGKNLHDKDFKALLDEGLKSAGLSKSEIEQKKLVPPLYNTATAPGVLSGESEDLVAVIGRYFAGKGESDPVECPICQKLFMRRGGLFSHCKIIHKVNMAHLYKLHRKKCREVNVGDQEGEPEDLIDLVGRTLETTATNDPVACPICKLMFVHRNGLYQHGKGMHRVVFSEMWETYKKRQSGEISMTPPAAGERRILVRNEETGDVEFIDFNEHDSNVELVTESENLENTSDVETVTLKSLAEKQPQIIEGQMVQSASGGDEGLNMVQLEAMQIDPATNQQVNIIQSHEPSTSQQFHVLTNPEEVQNFGGQAIEIKTMNGEIITFDNISHLLSNMPPGTQEIDLSDCIIDTSQVLKIENEDGNMETVEIEMPNTSI